MNKSRENLRITRHDIILIAVSIIVILGIVFLAFFLFDGANTNMQYRERFEEYNDDWTLVIDGKEEKVSLPAYAVTGEDGQVIIRNTLPDYIPEYHAIVCRNYHQILEVRIDGELRYRYPDFNRSRFINLITDDWNMIELRSDDAGKEIEISLIQSLSTGFDGYIQEILYGEDNYLIQHLRTKYTWIYLAGMSIAVAGSVLVIMGWIYRRYTDQKAQASMGMVLLTFGVWLADRTKMPITSINSDVKFLIAFICLLLIPVFIFLYDSYRFSEKWRPYSILGFRLSLIIVAVILLTSMFGGYSLETMTTVSYVMSFISIMYTIFLLFQVSYGKESHFKDKNDLMINRIELFVTMALPIGITLEVILSSDELWTEISGLYRTFINIYAIGYIITLLFSSYIGMRDRAVVTEKLHESQLELMMGQIQPHFIFNTLSSIRTLIKIDPDTAYRMIYDFSNYLRANVDNITNLDGINFAAEVEHIKSYVNIEKVRFGERLNVEYDTRATDFIVPPLSIQPLMENAIKHGVCQRPEGGTVWLRSYGEEDYYVVEVEDNGVGFDQEAIQAVFSLDDSEDEGVGMESNEASANALQEILDSSTLRDADGNIIEINEPIKGDFKGNGSEEHKSTGMRNISLRLREMSGAKMEISSQIGKGTLIKVYFPKGGVPLGTKGSRKKETGGH